jgi:hypothetical protein
MWHPAAEMASPFDFPTPTGGPWEIFVYLLSFKSKSSVLI